MNQETPQNEMTIFDTPFGELSEFQQDIVAYATKAGLTEEIKESILYIRYVKDRKL